MTKTDREIERKADILLITGDGKTLPQDLEKFLSFHVEHEVMTIGRSIKLYPGIVMHYADVDADAGKWVVENLLKNNPDKGRPITHTLGSVPWFDVGWEIEDCPWPPEDIIWHGSTALFAVLIGLAMGYHRIVLAGCPMDSKGHWYNEGETYGPKWTFESYQSWFEFAVLQDAFKVSSMSGYTATLLGETTPENLESWRWTR